MSLRTILAALTLSLVATAAQAAGGGEKKAADIGQYVNLQPIALPIVAYGEVINYVFVSVRIDLTAGANATTLRAKEPYFRDALVRAGHRTPFVATKDYLTVDEAKVKAAMLREAIAIAGARDIKGVVILSQTAKRHSGVPKPRGT